jgi:hypothetical protein
MGWKQTCNTTLRSTCWTPRVKTRDMLFHLSRDHTKPLLSLDHSLRSDELDSRSCASTDTVDTKDSGLISMALLMLAKGRNTVDAQGSQHLQPATERLPDLLLKAAPAELIVSVLPNALQDLPPDIATAVVKAVLTALPAVERLPDLALAASPAAVLPLQSVPVELIALVLPNALQELPPDMATAVMKAVLAALPAVPLQSVPPC